MVSMGENSTIDFYNATADKYFELTVGVDMSEICDRFLKYVKPYGRIMDIGAGSGRDVKYFAEKGYTVEGVDASEKLCKLASEYTGIEIKCQRIQDWTSTRKYDGIWANASLVHLEENEIEKFILNAERYLLDGGVMFFSLKNGIKTGTSIDGRFFIDFPKEKVQQILAKSTVFVIKDIWETTDKLSRNNFSWVNCIVEKVA